MSVPTPRPVAPTSEEREAVISALGDAYAADRLELDELEQRMARVYRATTREALAEVLADLTPSSRPAGAVRAGAVAPRPAAPLSALALEYGVATIARPEVVPERQALLAIFSGVERKGAWVVPRLLKVTVIMGGATLDLREAQFAEGVTEIEVMVIMGGLEIYVPAGLRVETVGAGYLGGFSVRSPEADPGPEAPVLRLRGLAALGGVDATVKKLRKKR